MPLPASTVSRKRTRSNNVSESNDDTSETSIDRTNPMIMNNQHHHHHHQRWIQLWV